MEDISFETEETTLVHCRSTRTTKALPSRSIAQAVRLGLVDLIGDGALPLPLNALKPGGRTLGDGFGHAWIRSRFAPDKAVRMTLLGAQHVVRNKTADYATPDGSEPTPEEPKASQTSKHHAVAVR